MKPILALAFAALVHGCGPAADAAPDPLADRVESGAADGGARGESIEGIEVPPPPFSAGVFPCSDCHDPEIEVNTRRRPMRTAHQEIVLRHDEVHRWCLDCHAAGDRDQLHLANGELVAFEESYKLCGQCHGDKYRDWRAGVHGRRSGQWDGHKTYLLCVHCHNAHAPAFQPLAPEPPPRAPAGPGGTP